MSEGLTDALVNPNLNVIQITKVMYRFATDVQEVMAESLALKRYLLKLNQKESERN